MKSTLDDSLITIIERDMKKSLLLYIMLSAITFLYAQQSFGTIEGKLKIEYPKQEKAEINVNLVEVSARSLVQTSKVSGEGRFIFYNVPFATYDLIVENTMEMYNAKRVVVNSPVVINVEIDSIKRQEFSPVIIIGTNAAFDKSRASSHTVVSERMIDELPVSSSTKVIENILLSTPGAIPDEDGRMHFRGEDAQMQYIIDGIPITGNLTRVYSSLFNASMIKSVDIQTGNFGAEYGVDNSAILSVNTKSGFDKELFGSAFAGLGTFKGQERGFDLGGTVSKGFALYGNLNYSSSDKYLDPIMSSQPNHSSGKNISFFGKGDVVLSSQMQLHFLGNMNKTDFEIPNTKPNSKQDQRQAMNDYMAGFRMNYNINSSGVLSLLGYRRYSKTEFTSNGLKKLSYPSDTSSAMNNDKMFIGAERINENNGGQLDYSTNQNWCGVPHVFLAGISREIFPLKEFFNFAITNPLLTDTSVAGGDLAYKSYDLTKGGKPFLVDAARTGKRVSAYLQDQFMYNDKWSFSCGLRFDRYSLFENETELSPRISATYLWSDDLIFHISYNRIFMQVPVENILVSSSNEALQITKQVGTSNIVKSERSNVLELGGAYKLNSNVDFELVGYSKLIDNFIVKVELGNSGIIFPVNLKKGLVAGGELRTRLHNWNNISATLSFSTCASLGLKPNDGSNPIGAGLIIGEEGQNYSHPFAGEDMFKTEHNQLFTAVLDIAYHNPNGFYGTLNGRFDSGLPFDLAGKDGVGLDEAASIAELKSRGYSDAIISLLSLSPEKPGSPDKSLAPRVLFDLGLGYDFRNSFDFPLKLSANILNLLNTEFLYKFESSFSGTHYGYPRMVSVRAELGIN